MSKIAEQIGIDYPRGNIHKIKPPISTAKGASQVGIPKETPRGKPAGNPNENCTPIKSIHPCRTSEGAYFIVLPRLNPTSALSKKLHDFFSTNQKREFNSYTKNWKIAKMRFGR